MFERPTVFIVGAGASKEIGLPLGSDLTKAIAEKLNVRYKDGWTLSNGDPCIAEAVVYWCRQNPSLDPNSYFHAGRSISGAMVQAISIDNYLHSHSYDQQTVWMGKLAVAQCILNAERSSSIANRDGRGGLRELSNAKDTWYNTFFQMLHEGVQPPDLDKIFDNVSIVTFNYDRSIEHFLPLALSNYYGIPDDEAQGLVAALRIEHPYGQVGLLPWQDRQRGVAYGNEPGGQLLNRIAGQIRTFTERVDDGEMLKRTRDLIGSAEVVVYLGFSYGQMNMDLLSVDTSAVREVYGTSFGISAANKIVVYNDISESLGVNSLKYEHIELDDLTCHKFLVDYWRPILRGVSGPAPPSPRHKRRIAT